MMDTPIGMLVRRTLSWWMGWILAVGLAHTAAGQDLRDFGYKIQQTRSDWPALAVLVDFTPAGTYNMADWHDYVFDPNNEPDGLNRYYQEVSLGRFLLSEGDTVRIVEPVANNSSNTLARLGEDADITIPYHSNLVHSVMHSGQFPFEDYDADGNGTVSGDELLIIFLLEGEGGAVRWAGRVTCTNCPVAFRGSVGTSPLAASTGAFTTLAHEMTHLLGAVDLYGIWGTDQDINRNLSLMSSGLVYLDPWHQLRFGWREARVRELRTGGSINIPAAQLGYSNAPVILYDPDHGPQEYFLLEYRSVSNTVFGTGYERELAGDGLVVWHVYHDANTNIVPYCDVVYPIADQDWYECKKCRALIKKSDLGSSTCAAGGTHEPNFGDVANPRDKHTLQFNITTAPYEDGWVRCSKCGMLYYGPSEGASDCAVGGNHAAVGSLNYSLRKNTTDLVGHNKWYRCTRCQSLFFGNRWEWNGVNWVHLLAGCPDGGNHIVGPDEYILNAAWSDRTMLTRGAPDLLHGSNGMWSSGTWTPYLSWYAAGNTGVQLHVYEYDLGDSFLTVEWRYPFGECWVDFNYTGIEEGTFSRPYNTYAEGVSAVSRGGTLHIKAGQSAETRSVSKPMTIRSYNGNATIGR